MRACKCDRCGEYYDEYKKDIDDLPEELINHNRKCRGDYINGLVLEGYNVNTGIRGNSRHIDLCPEFMEELMAFLDGKYKHAITIKCDGNSIEECVRRLKNDR